MFGCTDRAGFISYDADFPANRKMMLNSIAVQVLVPALTALLVLCRPSTTAAQSPCRGDVPADVRGRAYGYRQFGDRCEGACARLASNPTALRVVGFRRGVVFPSRESPPRLAVQWSAPAASGGTLRVTAVRGPRCYHMDAHAHANGFSWSSHIMDALEVQPAWLAAVVYVRGEVNGTQDTMMVPAEPAGGRAPDQPLVVELVPGHAFRRVVFTVRRVTDNAVIGSEHVVPEPYFPANEVIRFRLPPNLPREVPLRLRIVGDHGGGTNLINQLFWIPR
jgi:hypothetical protein